MTPLEIMAKALWENQPSDDEDGEDTWANAPDWVKDSFRDQARAAIRALASIPECDFPGAVSAAGRIADEECGTIGHGLRASFRAMLKAIAEMKSS